ncbi:MAG: CoA pyrophosphatase [Thermoproteota archaeon]|nr:CoA pyrophosphatase [Thermoproteota archaeon]
MISEKQFCDLLLNSERLKITRDKDIMHLNYPNSGKIFSSVLVIIHFPEKIPSVILTKRSSFLTNHSGEISFPGGKFSSNDKTILDTAIRETYEEIGIVVDKKKVIGCLQPTYTYTSKILIYPFVALEEKISDNLKPNVEVEQIISLPIEKLMRSFSEDELHSTKKYRMFKFLVEEYIIWGATARILKDLLDVIMQ